MLFFVQSHKHFMVVAYGRLTSLPGALKLALGGQNYSRENVYNTCPGRIITQAASIAKYYTGV
jgi:hypothetical protein